MRPTTLLPALAQTRPGVLGPVVLIGALLASCKEPETFDRAAMLEATTEQVILATHADLTSSATALDTSLDTFCGDRTVANLEAARTAWLAVKQPLKLVEAWSFGPYRYFQVDLARNIDKWPGDAANIEAILSADDEITVEYVEGLDYRDRIKGYPAIGYLLHSEADAAATVAAYDDRRCAYLTTLSEHAQGYGTAYAQAWAPGGDDYASDLTTAGQGSDAYPTQQEAVAALVGGMLTATNNVSMLKLGIPAGNNTGGTPAPTEAEAHHSGTSVQHALWALEGAERLYGGAEGQPEATALTDLVQFREAEGSVDAAVRTRFDEAQAAVAAIPAPLAQAVQDDPEAVQSAIAAVDALSTTLSGELSTLLGINPTAVEGDND